MEDQHTANQTDFKQFHKETKGKLSKFKFALNKCLPDQIKNMNACFFFRFFYVKVMVFLSRKLWQYNFLLMIVAELAIIKIQAHSRHSLHRELFSLLINVAFPMSTLWSVLLQQRRVVCCYLKYHFRVHIHACLNILRFLQCIHSAIDRINSYFKLWLVLLSFID